MKNFIIILIVCLGFTQCSVIKTTTHQSKTPVTVAIDSARLAKVGSDTLCNDSTKVSTTASLSKNADGSVKFPGPASDTQLPSPDGSKIWIIISAFVLGCSFYGYRKLCGCGSVMYKKY